MSYISPVNKSLCLQILYEENYAKLIHALPFLKQPEDELKASHKNIRIDLLEKCPYTLTINLQSLGDSKNLIGPTITCRLYLDAQSVEVLDVNGFIPSLTKFHGDTPRTVLDKKWVLNYFLEQWLIFNGRPSEKTNKPNNMVNA
jgi:uncharacterized protein YqiB (DUF1249 family)